MNKVLIAAGLIAIAAVGYYIIRKKKKPNSKQIITIRPEVFVDELKLSDTVSYFKSLQLKKGEDKPFVGYDIDQSERFNDIFKVERKTDNAHIVLLGVYREDTDEMMPMRCIECQSIDSELVSILGGEDFIVLQ